MTLDLPADIEEYVGTDFHTAAVYALDLQTPADLAEALAEHYTEMPPWLSRARAAERVVYVGATGDLLGRLEDHRDGDARTVPLVDACGIDGLRDVWVYDDANSAFNDEYNRGRDLGRAQPSWYVHQR
jgi:predicted GIY-YIG superfamily endonuclease